jgi:hypothetical protein
MKREFPFDTALKALEVTWSSLPPATADTKVRSPVIVLFRAVDPDSDSDPIRIQGFDDQILKKKKTAENYFFFSYQILQFTIPKLQEKPSALKREHPALQKMKFIKFSLCLWVILALMDPDPDTGTPLDPDPIQIRVRIRIHSTGFI